MTDSKSAKFELKGTSVSKGSGSGFALCLHGSKRQFVFDGISASDTGVEVSRLSEAVRIASNQVESIIEENDASLRAIFEVHHLFLNDQSLNTKIQNKIRTERLNAEWAVSLVFEDYISKYKGLTDKHIREKYIDLEDVRERILSALGTDERRSIEFKKGSVIVAKELSPSTLIELSKNRPSAIVTTTGGWTSHSFILARELGIPAVTGIKDVVRHIKSGCYVEVDGTLGTVIVSETVGSVSEEKRVSVTSNPELIDYPKVATVDDEIVTVSLNLDIGGIPKDPAIARFDIGLFRSEFLFQSYGRYPSESAQVETYRDLFDYSDSSLVRIRTFDLSAADLLGAETRNEKNPALGLRGIRYALKDKIQLQVQIRSLLKAGSAKRLGIVIPMVSDVSEITAVKEIVEQEAGRIGLEERPSIGAMIELPAAVIQIEEILSVVDFINIGTNDLVQYTLAVDRDNDAVSNYFRTLNPAILKSLKLVLTAANALGKESVVCGETAGSGFYSPLLIGLGARTLSMNPQKTHEVAEVIGSVRAADCARIAEILLSCRTQDLVESEIRRLYKEYWPHLAVIHR